MDNKNYTSFFRTPSLGLFKSSAIMILLALVFIFIHSAIFIYSIVHFSLQINITEDERGISDTLNWVGFSFSICGLLLSIIIGIYLILRSIFRRPDYSYKPKVLSNFRSFSIPNTLGRDFKQSVVNRDDVLKNNKPIKTLFFREMLESSYFGILILIFVGLVLGFCLIIHGYCNNQKINIPIQNSEENDRARQRANLTVLLHSIAIPVTFIGFGYFGWLVLLNDTYRIDWQKIGK